MKNKEFFYLQYDKINWQNQEKTKINSFVNNFIIQNFISKKEADEIKLFDIGFGIGFFLQLLEQSLSPSFENIILEGCEPSQKNYKYFETKKLEHKTFNKTFLQTETDTKFDFLTAIYVFPHFESDELNNVAQKINYMLNSDGRFILVVANEDYLEKKLQEKKDLFIERNNIEFNGKKYEEVLHYSEIPEIGTVIDYNREEKLYIDLFQANNFTLKSKEELDDNGFICTIFVFSKK